MTPDALARDVMVAWLRHGPHGCVFASKFASEPTGHIRPLIVSGTNPGSQLPEQLQPALIDAADHKEAVLVVFPDFRLDEHIALLVEALARDQRWSCREVPWSKFPRNDALIRLDWKTPAGPRTVAMGLAPLGTMPLTRRAPFVAIAIWPGGKENLFHPYREQNPDRVSLADMPHSLEQDAHTTYWNTSVERKRELSEALREGAARPTVSFCLRRDVLPLITTLEAQEQTGKEGAR